jgi:hypothetical protein
MKQVTISDLKRTNFWNNFKLNFNPQNNSYIPQMNLSVRGGRGGISSSRMKYKLAALAPPPKFQT